MKSVMMCQACGCESDSRTKCPICGHECIKDRLVKVVTAFRNWSAMVDAMRAGYIPTIYPRDRRHVMLTRILRSEGFRVFDGSKVR